MAQPDDLWCYSGIDNRISDDQRKLLKDKTGFEGYTAYLEDCDKKHSGYGQLLETWRNSDFWLKIGAICPMRCYCDIFDLIKDENSSISLNLCCRTASNSELFTALSEPGKGVYGRIVIWRSPKHMTSDKFLEDLGLALKISPTFLKPLFMKNSHGLRRYTHIPVFAASHVMVGDRFATMTRCCLSEKSNDVPIVFIADLTYTTLEHPRMSEIFKQPDTMRGYGISGYGEMIMGIIKRNEGFSKSADALILPALLAAVHMDSYNLRASIDSSRAKGQHWGNVETMNAERNELRRKIVEFEDVMQDALEGFNSLYGAGWSQKYECESTLEYFTETINRARRFEAYVRDQCQADIGQLSLVESKKSIELSISQLEEGKRVKIFTVLAFVYVPLNLATSIFGMNIQQLNRSGQSIQTSLVTALVILLLTGGLWLGIAEVNGYRSWSRRPRKIPSVLHSPRPDYNIAVRVRMLVWLYRNEHWAWVRKTKAWWYILANSRGDRNNGFGARNPAIKSALYSPDRGLSAGEYISKYMDSEEAFNAFGN